MEKNISNRDLDKSSDYEPSNIIKNDKEGKINDNCINKLKKNILKSKTLILNKRAISKFELFLNCFRESNLRDSIYGREYYYDKISNAVGKYFNYNKYN